MENNPYQNLASRLDALPNGFPPSKDGVELQILAKLFTPEEAGLAAQLRLTLETVGVMATRINANPVDLRKKLKSMARRGLIAAGPVEGGLGFGLMPFVVGIYEMQAPVLDAELAGFFERYFLEVFGRALAIEPSVHRVIPINASIPLGLEIQPFESAAGILAAAKAWGVMDCICRKQKQLIGQGCSHPLDVCLTMSSTPGAFDLSSVVHALTQDEALATLRRAAEAGLVHSVSNFQKDLWYICNCCTCSCGILRGMADLGLANVIAKSAYLNRVDVEKCILCGVCVERCQFDALILDDELRLNEQRCTGCGVCTIACPEDALHLVLRSPSEISTPPQSETDWRVQRAQSRNLDLREVL
jgi:electron transport complex protein RnfB